MLGGLPRHILVLLILTCYSIHGQVDSIFTSRDEIILCRIISVDNELIRYKEKGIEKTIPFSIPFDKQSKYFKKQKAFIGLGILSSLASIGFGIVSIINSAQIDMGFGAAAVRNVSPEKVRNNNIVLVAATGGAITFFITARFFRNKKKEILNMALAERYSNISGAKDSSK